MMNQQNGFKNQAFRITALTLAMAAIGAQTSARTLRSGALESDMELRSTHARELLGKSYDRSAANVAGRHYEDFGRFIYETTREMLPVAQKGYAGAIVNAILTESRRNRLDPVFTMSVIAHESRFKTDARGTHGEIGLMQVMPRTAAWIAHKIGMQTPDIRKSLKDPFFNIRVGTAYLAMLRERFDAHGSYYLAAYNMGARKLLRTVHSAGMPHNYASGVMKFYLTFYGSYRERLAQNL